MVSICLRPLLILLLLVQWLAATEMNKEEIEALLNRLPTSPRSLDFRESKTLRLLKEPILSEGQLTVAPPGKFRRVVTRPNASLAVSNGQTLWLYYPNFAEAEKYDLTRNSPIAKMIEAISASFDRKQLMGLFEIQGTREKTGYSLSLHPKKGALRRNLVELRIHLSPDSKLTETEMLMKDGSRTLTSYRNEQEIHPAPAFFDFQPPAGVKVSEPLK